MINGYLNHRSQSPCGLKHKSAATRLLGLRVQTPLRAQMFVSFICCVLCSCVCVCLIVCDLETPTMRQPMPKLGCCGTEENDNLNHQM